MSNDATRQAIIKAAQEEGIDPSMALAYAERESKFDPQSGGTGSIRGLYQMTASNRKKYGVGLNDDAYTQTKGFARFIKDVGGEMTAGSGGRKFSDAETYAGHHFGGVRAGRMFNMDPSTPVDQVFSAREMAGNPHFAKAGTVGRLLNSVTGDIQQRQAKFGGSFEQPDFASFGDPVDVPAADFTALGEPVESTATGSQAQPAAPVANASSNAKAMPQSLPDFSSMGAPLA